MINLKKKYTDCLNFVVNKVVILRLDLNLPSYDGLFTDLTRLEKVIPTIEDLLKNNAKLVIISHLGRPRGKVSEKYSLKPIVAKLEQKIKIPVAFSENDILKTKPEKILKKLEDEKILMLENIRFYPEEEKNDDEFSKRLSKFGDIFINECFSVSHRNHSSIVGIPKFLPSFPGKLLEFEVNFIKSIISNKDIKNNVAVLGGAKISTKINIVKYLAKNFKKVLVGGAMANTFLAAKKQNVGESFYEPSMINVAQKILVDFDEKIVLPEDVIVIKSPDEESFEVKSVDNIFKNEKIMDIGPKTRMNFAQIITSSEGLIWNGPLGLFEKIPFDAGTKYVASAVQSNKNKNFFSVAGGGDTISMLKQANCFDGFSFLSTGGGAFLEFIQGNSLPGLLVLNE